VNRLGAVLISRRKADCAGATLDLLEAVPAREIMLGLTDRDRSPTIKAIMAAMASNGIPVRTLSRPDSGVLPGKVTWRVLHPESSLDAGAADDQALALRLERGRAAVLIRTESSPCVSSNLLGASAAPLAAEILVLADSAPNADPQPDFLRAAAPHVLVNSASQRSPDGLPATSLRVAIGPMQSVEISLDPDSASLSQPVDME